MPLEIFEGKTGQRLIARLPIKTGSYAVVTTDLPWRLAVYHIPGLYINGYPALSPVLRTVREVTARMEREREAVRDTYDTVQRSIDATRTKIATKSVRSVLDTLTQLVLNLDQSSLDHARPMIDKPIICTSIMIGRELQFKLASTMFGDVSSLSMGTVTSFDIFNSP